MTNIIEKRGEGAPSGEDDTSENLEMLNSINIQPEAIEAKESHLWKKKDLSHVKDLKTLEAITDWSFCTPYKGSILPVIEMAEIAKKEIGKPILE